jgi:phage shock protein C
MNGQSDNRNPFRLYRDPQHGLLAGVCAGIAEFFGVERIVIRLATVLALIFFFPPTVLAYVVLALALPTKPPALYGSRDEEEFWRGVSMAPGDTLQSLQRKFRSLDERLGQMESQVTSGDFELHRKFRDLGR